MILNQENCNAALEQLCCREHKGRPRRQPHRPVPAFATCRRSTSRLIAFSVLSFSSHCAMLFRCSRQAVVMVCCALLSGITAGLFAELSQTAEYYMSEKSDLFSITRMLPSNVDTFVSTNMQYWNEDGAFNLSGRYWQICPPVPSSAKSMAANWAKHSDESFRAVRRLHEQHFHMAIKGSVTNANVFAALRRRPVTEQDRVRFALADGSSIRRLAAKNWSSIPQNTWDVLRTNLNESCNAAFLSYGGLVKVAAGATHLFRRFLFVLFGSSLHPDAGSIAYQLDWPKRFANDPPCCEYLQKSIDGLAEGGGWWTTMQFQPHCIPQEIDEWSLRVHISFRGSKFELSNAALHDWAANFDLFDLHEADSYDETFLPHHTPPVHSGYLRRFRAFFPTLLTHVQQTTQRVQAILSTNAQQHRRMKNATVQLMFEVAGHSQGGALAMLTALAFSRAYPTSSIKLFTFSMPAIFPIHAVDPLDDTCIRHLRYAVNKDLVVASSYGVWSWLEWAIRRRHVGRTHLTVDADHAPGMRWWDVLGWHTGSIYLGVLRRLSTEDLSVGLVQWLLADDAEE